MPPPVIATVPFAGWVTSVIVFGPPSIGVVGEHVDRVGARVLGDGGGVVHRGRVVIGAVDGDRHGRGRAAVQGVGEVVGRVAAVAVVLARGVGEPGAAAGDRDGPVRAAGSTSVIVFGPPSSVSLASTSIGLALESSATVAASFDRGRVVIGAVDGDRHGRGRAAVQGVGEVVGRVAAVAVVLRSGCR